MKKRYQALRRYFSGWSKITVLMTISMQGILTFPANAGPTSWDDDIRQAQVDGRWSDVARIYQEQLGKTPDRGDLWVKLADVEAARGNTGGVMPALVMAVKGAPDNTEYMKARAQIANWLGRYRIAGDSYERLLALTTGSSYGLMLARSRTWQGDLDGAAKAYRDYVKTHTNEPDVWLEYVRVEGWRGNLAKAIALLNQYEKNFSSLPKPDADRARLLAWANKPREATRINDELLVKKPEDYEFNVTRTVALKNGNQKQEAVKSLDKLVALRPDSQEVVEMKRYVTTALRPDITGYGRYYYDRDHLAIWEEALNGGLFINPETRIGASVDLWQLKADVGSGLENRDGSRSADYQKGILQFQHDFLPSLWLNAAAGAAEVDGAGSLFVYDVLVGSRPWDDLTVSLEESRDSLLISPRSASLGIRRDTTQLQAEWTPGLLYTVVGQVRDDRYSDGNDRWEAVLAPRRSVIRSDIMNLDLGVRGLVFGYSEDLNSGYYDPSLYQQYALTALSYWKISPESGLSLIGAAGYYKDNTMNNFDFGWSADSELTVGAHSDWMLKLSGHYMQNFRSLGGAYHAVSADLSLTRRF